MTQWNGSVPSEPTGYVFDNGGLQAARRFAGHEAILDSGTIRHLRERGVAPGWHCLEVGAGSGSVTTWLAGEVGLAGHVLATDIDTRFLEGLARPNLEVRRHDIAVDPLPQAVFDLVHARLVLQHVPARDHALRRMAAALRPGGWIVVEEYGAPQPAPDPRLDPAEVPLRAHAAMMQVMDATGVDRDYGRRLPTRMRDLGLSDIGAEGRIFRFSGGSPGAQVTRAGIEQLSGAILASGLVTEDELEADLARLDDPRHAHPSRLLWAVWAQRPTAS